MSSIVERYGEKAKDIIDLVMVETENEEIWKDLCINMGKCTKSTKKVYINSRKQMYEYEIKHVRDENRRWVAERIDYPEPRYKRNIRVRNGRSTDLIWAEFYEDEIPQILEDIKQIKANYPQS